MVVQHINTINYKSRLWKNNNRG